MSQEAAIRGPHDSGRAGSAGEGTPLPALPPGQRDETAETLRASIRRCWPAPERADPGGAQARGQARLLAQIAGDETQDVPPVAADPPLAPVTAPSPAAPETVPLPPVGRAPAAAPRPVPVALRQSAWPRRGRSPGSTRPPAGSAAPGRRPVRSAGGASGRWPSPPDCCCRWSAWSSGSAPSTWGSATPSPGLRRQLAEAPARRPGRGAGPAGRRPDAPDAGQPAPGHPARGRGALAAADARRTPRSSRARAACCSSPRPPALVLSVEGLQPPGPRAQLPALVRGRHRRRGERRRLRRPTRRARRALLKEMPAGTQGIVITLEPADGSPAPSGPRGPARGPPPTRSSSRRCGGYFSVIAGRLCSLGRAPRPCPTIALRGRER